MVLVHGANTFDVEQCVRARQDQEQCGVLYGNQTTS